MCFLGKIVYGRNYFSLVKLWSKLLLRSTSSWATCGIWRVVWLWLSWPAAWHVDRLLSFIMICLFNLFQYSNIHSLCMVVVTRERDLIIYTLRDLISSHLSWRERESLSQRAKKVLSTSSFSPLHFSHTIEKYLLSSPHSPSSEYCEFVLKDRNNKSNYKAKFIGSFSLVA